MTNKKRILWTTQTAVFISLLIVFQAVTLPLGNTLITGSGVNLLLILSVMLCGLSSGLAVSALSPIFAKFLGIGPLWSIIPMIIIGNIIFVLIWHYLGNTAKLKVNIARISALTAASLAKFLFLYFSIVKLVLPFLLHLPEKQNAVISGMFSLPQLITAATGGIMAILLLPVLQRYMNTEGRDNG